MKPRKKPHNIATIINLWPDPSELASDLGVSLAAVYKMRARSSINAKHLPTLMVAAERRGLAIDAATLLSALKAA